MQWCEITLRYEVAEWFNCSKSRSEHRENIRKFPLAVAAAPVDWGPSSLRPFLDWGRFFIEAPFWGPHDWGPSWLRPPFGDWIYIWSWFNPDLTSRNKQFCGWSLSFLRLRTDSIAIIWTTSFSWSQSRYLRVGKSNVDSPRRIRREGRTSNGQIHKYSNTERQPLHLICRN